MIPFQTMQDLVNSQPDVHLYYEYLRNGNTSGSSGSAEQTDLSACPPATLARNVSAAIDKMMAARWAVSYSDMQTYNFDGKDLDTLLTIKVQWDETARQSWYRCHR